MEFTKMLTLSTGHIQESTAKFLDNEERQDLVVYQKETYGWFIYLKTEHIQEELKRIPEELAKLIVLAKENDCSWLCLDCDGEVEEELPSFDW